MRPRPPLGVIRLLVPIVARAGLRRRRPLAAMIWRRHGRAAATAPAGRAAPVPAAGANYAINLHLSWLTAAAAAPSASLAPAIMLREFRRLGGERVVAPAAGRLMLLVRQLEARAAPGLGIPAHSPSKPRSRRDAVVAPNPEVRSRDVARLTAPRLFRTVADRQVIRARAEASPPPPSFGTGSTRVTPALRPRPASGRGTALELRRLRQATPPLASAPAPQSTRSPLALVWQQANVQRHGSDAATARPASPREVRRGSDLVWRMPPSPNSPAEPSAASVNAVASRRPSAAAVESTVAAPRSAPPPAVAQVDVGRLVDEVLRRLERIGRDERMRRGI